MTADCPYCWARAATWAYAVERTHDTIVGWGHEWDENGIACRPRDAERFLEGLLGEAEDLIANAEYDMKVVETYAGMAKRAEQLAGESR